MNVNVFYSYVNKKIKHCKHHVLIKILLYKEVYIIIRTIKFISTIQNKIINILNNIKKYKKIKPLKIKGKIHNGGE